MKRKFFVLIFIATLFVFGISILSCRKKEHVTATSTMPASSVNNADGLKYLALGDSYTIGESVKEEERFPYYVASLLHIENILVKDIRYIAQTGWSTIALQHAIASQEPLGSFDIVTLLIGVNDQYQRLDTAGYRVRFGQLLDKAVQLAGNRASRVFVLSIPDYSTTPFVHDSDKERVSREIAFFNSINKEITLQQKIAYINITPETQKAANDPSLLANDQLHYSGKEHKIWAELVVPYVKKAIR